MIEKQLYECEYCHTRYNNREEALECEANHKIVDHIAEGWYTSKSHDKRGLPYRIAVVFNDGTSVMYDEVIYK